MKKGATSVFQSVQELADHIGISRQKCYEGLRSGQIPSIRLGKRFVIPRSAIDEWLKSAGATTAATFTPMRGRGGRHVN